ncbi:uncharacterized protein LOC117106797 [Anneissia japonica]|uniref:uncharacterized protein LOC117106797 n=1 Tax=Anneissia japonica TaxID=1529436 RepID=UPI001425ADAE|nr:uncharacterized protein LOC117106797 [Anneissia japonica]
MMAEEKTDAPPTIAVTSSNVTITTVPENGHDGARPDVSGPLIIPDNNMVSIALMSDFLRQPPSNFRVKGVTSNGQPGATTAGDQVLTHDRDEINVCVRLEENARKFENNMGGFFPVLTESALEAISRTLCNRPILLDIRLRQKTKYNTNTVVIIHDDFAVIVNTQHERIKQQLANAFEEAKSCAKVGRKFVLTLDFGPLLKDWLNTFLVQQGLQEYEWYSKTESKNGRIVITNHYELPEHCTGSRDNILMWLLCFPCCFLSCPCYNMYRAVTCYDRKIRFIAQVSLMHKEGTSLADTKTELVAIIHRDSARFGASWIRSYHRFRRMLTNFSNGSCTS